MCYSITYINNVYSTKLWCIRIIMEIIVGLNSKEKRKMTKLGTPAYDLGELVSGINGVRLIKVYGKGRYATVEVNTIGFVSLKQKMKHICNFSPVLDVHPFELVMK